MKLFKFSLFLIIGIGFGYHYLFKEIKELLSE